MAENLIYTTSLLSILISIFNRPENRTVSSFYLNKMTFEKEATK